MRILLTNIYYAPWSFGGATTVVENLAREFHELGHEVHVFCGRPNGKLDYKINHRFVEGIQVHEINLPHHSRELEFDNLSVAQEFRRLIEDVKPDLIHHHAIQHLGYKIVEISSELCKVNLVTLHDAWWMCSRQFMIDIFGNYCNQSTGIKLANCATCAVEDSEQLHYLRNHMIDVLNRVDGILVPSAFWKDLMIASGARAELVSINSNGLVEPSFVNNKDTKPLRFGYLGGESRIKGFDKVIDSFELFKKLVSNEEPKLVLVDNQTNMGGRTLWPKEVYKNKNIILSSGFTPEEKDSFYSSIDVLLFPSRWDESFGLSVREALQRGVYVIATDSGGVPECIISSIQGTILSKNCTPEDLADAMAVYFRNPPSRSQILDATVRASNIVLPRTQANEILSLHKELLKQ
jgi:O-antigen biosynthesis protein